MSYHFKHQTDDRKDMLGAINEAGQLPSQVQSLLYDAVFNVPEDEWEEWVVEVNGHQCSGEGSYAISTLNMRVGPA